MKYQNRSVSIVGMLVAAALSFSPISQGGAALLGDPFREFNRATKRRHREDDLTESEKLERRKNLNNAQLERVTWNERLARRNGLKVARNRLRKASTIGRDEITFTSDIPTLEVERAIDYLHIALDQRALHIKDIEFIVYAPFFKTHEQDEAFYAQAKELKWLS